MLGWCSYWTRRWPNTVRRIVGPNMLIGWSTHSIQSDLKGKQIYECYRLHWSRAYFFYTDKPNANPVGIFLYILGKAFSKAPIVAIGGIKTTNTDTVWQAHPILFVPFLK